MTPNNYNNLLPHNYNNLCCLLDPFIVCQECGFRSCTPCDNYQGNWTLKTHNKDCSADNSRWDGYKVIIYRDTPDSLKEPCDILSDP